MKTHINQQGITLLLFAVLISSGMLLCLSAWKATTYFVDFSLEKELYLQNSAYVEGIMRYAVRVLEPKMWQDNVPVTVTIRELPCMLERFKNIHIELVAKPAGPVARAVTVTCMQEGVAVARARCVVTRSKRGEHFDRYISAWNIEA
jgi:hypothetical protein